MTEWRPDGWENMVHSMCITDGVPCDSKTCRNCDCRKPIEQTASAMLSALLKWLEEPCDKHPHLYRFQSFNLEKNQWNTQERVHSYPEHRYLCPQCMAELRGER